MLCVTRRGQLGMVPAVLAIASCSSSPEVPPLQRWISESEERDLPSLFRMAELARIQEDAEARIEHGWEFHESPPSGWAPLKDVAAVAVSNDALVGDAEGFDPSFLADLSAIATESHRVWVRLSSAKGGAGQLFWSPDPHQEFEEHRSVTFMVSGRSEPRDYLLPVGWHPAWKGSIERIRLDLPPVSGSFALDFVRLIQVDAGARELEALDGATGRAALHDDSRLSVLAGPPSRRVWDVVAHAGSRLRFSYGVLPEFWERTGSDTRFRVAIAPERGPERPIFSSELRPESREEDRRWHEASLSLAELPPGPLRIVFRTEALEPREGPPHAVWGDPQVATATAADPPNVVLIAIDTLRADRIGVYGYERDTTPHIDRFAREATLFEKALAQAPWTLPSLASLFTSQYPSMTGAGANDLGAMSPDAATLAYRLREAGYATHALTNGAYAGRHFGMARGFDRFWEGDDPDELTQKLSLWMEEEPSRPLFLFLQTYAAHDYFLATPRQVAAAEELAGRSLRLPSDILAAVVSGQGQSLSPESLAHISDLYDGAVREADALFGEWMAILKSAGVLDDAVVVLTSDHGEAFGEHGLTHHGNSLYRELVNVPLLFRRYPRSFPARRVPAQVELLDIAPTLLEHAAVRVPGEMAGRSLAPWLEGAARSEAGRGALTELKDARMFAILHGGFKYLYNGFDPYFHGCDEPENRRRYCEELFRTEEDPGEGNDVANSSPEDLERMRALLLSRLRGATPGLHVLARGGLEGTRVEIRITGAELSSAPTLYLYEEGDTADSTLATLDLPPGDVDVAIWEDVSEASLEELELQATARPASGASYLGLGIGPACRPIATQDGTGVVRGDDWSDAVVSVDREPSPDSTATLCVTFRKREVPVPDVRALSPDVLERLRALGYVP